MSQVRVHGLSKSLHAPRILESEHTVTRSLLPFVHRIMCVRETNHDQFQNDNSRAAARWSEHDPECRLKRVGMDGLPRYRMQGLLVMRGEARRHKAHVLDCARARQIQSTQGVHNLKPPPNAAQVARQRVRMLYDLS